VESGNAHSLTERLKEEQVLKELAVRNATAHMAAALAQAQDELLDTQGRLTYIDAQLTRLR